MIDEKKQSFLEKQFKNLRLTSLFIFPIVTFLAFRAQDIIPFFFGEGVEFAILPFQIIIWSVIFIYYSFLLLRIALFLNRKFIVLSGLAIEAISAGVLNFYLYPLYGLEGICIAIVASTAIMFGFIALSLTQIGIRIPFYQSGEKPVIGIMGLTVVLHYVDSWSFPFIFLSGIASYFLILIILSTLRKRD
jgi:O-antigen/teichoic acid export membrane protein